MPRPTMELREEDYQGTFNDFERKEPDALISMEDEGAKSILLDIAANTSTMNKKLEIGAERP